MTESKSKIDIAKAAKEFASAVEAMSAAFHAAFKPITRPAPLGPRCKHGGDPRKCG